jgi:hypothetical protein
MTNAIHRMTMRVLEAIKEYTVGMIAAAEL